jgi:hypothetical protein
MQPSGCLSRDGNLPIAQHGVVSGSNVIRLGDEHDEERPSTLIVEKVEIAAPADHSSSRGKKARAGETPMLRTFMTSVGIAFDGHGEMFQLPDGGPKVRAVNVEAVRPVYYAKRPDLDNSDSRGAAFRRHLEAAIDRQLLCWGLIDGQGMLWRP